MASLSWVGLNQVLQRRLWPGSGHAAVVLYSVWRAVIPRSSVLRAYTDCCVRVAVGPYVKVTVRAYACKLKVMVARQSCSLGYVSRCIDEREPTSHTASGEGKDGVHSTL